MTEVIPVNKRIMRLATGHSLGAISVASVETPTEISDAVNKHSF